MKALSSYNRYTAIRTHQKKKVGLSQVLLKELQ